MRLLYVLVLLGLPITAICKDKPDARLEKVNTVFVAGNNQAAERARAVLRSGKTCLRLAAKAEDADAILEIAAGSQGVGGNFGSFGGRTWTISGKLTLKSGARVWSRNENTSEDPSLGGGQFAGELLVKHFVQDAGCKHRAK